MEFDCPVHRKHASSLCCQTPWRFMDKKGIFSEEIQLSNFYISCDSMKRCCGKEDFEKGLPVC